MNSMIQQVPGMISWAAQPPAAVSGAQGPQSAPQAGDEAPVRPRTPVTDEYVPEEKREPSGLYWLGRDEDGRPKLYFDSPEQAASGQDEPEGPPAPEQGAAGGQKELCTGNTDQIDREIERLKQKREALERQIRAETDGVRVKALEQKLAQVERELGQKDNDAYRRQHTVFS